MPEGTNNNPVTGEDIQKLMGILTGFKGQYAQLDDDFKKFGAAQSETVVKLGKLTDDIVALQIKYRDDTLKRLDAMDAKFNRGEAETAAVKSLGEQVVENPAFLAAIKGGGRFSVTIAIKGPLVQLRRKAITGISQVYPEMLQLAVPLGYLPMGVRQLIPPGRTTAGSIEFIQELTFTNAAAPVNENTAKPQSDKTFQPVTKVVRTLAHYFKISKQTFDDLPFLVSLIENNGIYGVQLKEDQQLLYGTNVAPQLEGFMPVAAAAPAPPVPGTGEPPSTLVDAVGTAVFDLAAKGYMPDGTVVNPSDWGSVALLKNSQGNYLFANPMDYAPNNRLWGTRLVQSANMIAGNFLVGAFQGNSQLLDREELHVQIASQNEDDFIKNMYTMLIEERLVNVIYQPAAFTKGVVPVAAPPFAADARTQPRAAK